MLISTSRGNERNACSELRYLLGELGDRDARIDTTGIVGLVVAQTKIDPVEAMEGLRRKLIEDPWKFRYIQKVAPIQKVTLSEVEKIVETAVELSGNIKLGESFRITVEKRHTTLQSREIVETVAKQFERPVRLDDPDKIVLVQVMGASTGVSIVRPSDILSVEREKRAT